MDTLPGITDLDMLHFLFEIDSNALAELDQQGQNDGAEADTLRTNMNLHRRLIFQMFKEGVYSISQLTMRMD